MPYRLANVERLSLSGHPRYTAEWVRDRIAEDPAALGLGDVIVKSREHRRPRADRVQLLLHDAEALRRYAVELQLGRADDAQMIRAVESWDAERARRPGYEYCAVVVAEEISPRYRRVARLLSRSAPLVVVLMRGFAVGEHVTLAFATVFDGLRQGAGDGEVEETVVPDRRYWEQRGTPATAAIADEVLALVHEFAPGVQLAYHRFFIGLEQDGSAVNFATFETVKKALLADIKLPRSREWQAAIECAGLDLVRYDETWGAYRVRLRPGDVARLKPTLALLLREAHRLRAAP
jgi:hypothetical protein